MNRVKIIIIGSAVGILILLFLLSTLLSSLFSPSTTPPSSSVTPTSVQFSEAELFIASILPADRNTVYNPAQPLQITFTQEIMPQSLKYTTSPQTDILVVKGENSKTLIFAPRSFWTNGTTTITFLNSTVSVSGQVLKNPQTYILKTALPTIPQNLEGAY